jgi:hypothetical protein
MLIWRKTVVGGWELLESLHLNLPSWLKQLLGCNINPAGDVPINSVIEEIVKVELIVADRAQFDDAEKCNTQ